MEVGSKVNAGGIDTLVVFSLALAIQLLPPFSNEMQLGLIVGQNFYLFALGILSITGNSILSTDILAERHAGSSCQFHVSSTLYQLGNIETGYCNREQTYRSKNTKTTANIVRDNEACVTFLVSCCTCSPLLGISDGNDNLFGHVLTALLFALLLQQTESQGCLGGSTALANVDNTKLLVFQIFCQFVQIILTNVVSCKQNGRILAVIDEPLKTVAQCFNYGTGTQIRAANTCYNYGIAVLA